MPGPGRLVPWADRETNVAAEDAVADHRAPLFWGPPLLLARPGVDKALELPRPALGDPARQRLQPLFDRVVIILPACIDRDDAGFGIGLGGKRIFAAVIEPEHDNAERPRP